MDIRILKENFNNFVNSKNEELYLYENIENIDDSDYESQKKSAVHLVFENYFKLLDEAETAPVTEPETNTNNPAAPKSPTTAATNTKPAVSTPEELTSVFSKTPTGTVSLPNIKLDIEAADDSIRGEFDKKLDTLSANTKTTQKEGVLVESVIDPYTVLVLYRLLLSVPSFAKIFQVLSNAISKLLIDPFKKETKKGIVVKALSTVWSAVNKITNTWVFKYLFKLIIKIISLAKIPLKPIIYGFLMNIPKIKEKIENKSLNKEVINQMADRCTMLVISVILVIIAPYSLGFQVTAGVGAVTSSLIAKLDLQKATGLSNSDILSAVKSTVSAKNIGSILSTAKTNAIGSGKEVLDAARNSNTEEHPQDQDDLQNKGAVVSGELNNFINTVVIR